MSSIHSPWNYESSPAVTVISLGDKGKRLKQVWKVLGKTRELLDRVKIEAVGTDKFAVSLNNSLVSKARTGEGGRGELQFAKRCILEEEQHVILFSLGGTVRFVGRLC